MQKVQNLKIKKIHQNIIPFIPLKKYLANHFLAN